jgi:hypothetical protein
MHTLCNLDLDFATGDSARLSVQARHPECGVDSRSIGRDGKLHGQKRNEKQSTVFLDELVRAGSLIVGSDVVRRVQLYMIEVPLKD